MEIDRQDQFVLFQRLVRAQQSMQQRVPGEAGVNRMRDMLQTRVRSSWRRPVRFLSQGSGNLIHVFIDSENLFARSPFGTMLPFMDSVPSTESKKMMLRNDLNWYQGIPDTNFIKPGLLRSHK